MERREREREKEARGKLEKVSNFTLHIEGEKNKS